LVVKWCTEFFHIHKFEVQGWNWNFNFLW
jgi:hypothetical protein